MLDPTPSRPTRFLRRILFGVMLLLGAGAVVSGCGGSTDDHLVEARALQEAGDFSSSIDPLREVAARDPDHPEANYLLGLALVQTRQPTLAIWPLRKAADSEEFGAAAGLLLASTLLTTEGFEEAIAAVDRLLEDDPENLTALMVRARANMGIGQHEVALSDVDAALALQPEHLQALTTRAIVLAKLERMEDAEAAWQKLEASLRASGDANQSLRGCLALAGFYVEQELEQAEPTVKRCLDEAPGNPIALRVASEYYDGQEKPEVANALYREAVEEAPDQLVLRTTLASRLEDQGEEGEAEKVLTEAAELFDDPGAWDQLTTFYSERGRFEEAKQANERALAGAGRQPLLLFRQADMLVEAGEYEAAEEAAAELEPIYRDSIRGKLALKRGEPRQALEALEASLLRWPNNVTGRYLAGQAAEQLGDHEKALSHYREAVRTDDTATDAALAAAALRLAEGEHRQALEMAARQIGKRPYVGPEPYVVFVRSATALGRYDDGRRMLAKLAEHPDVELTVAVERAALERRAAGPKASLRVLETAELDLAEPANQAALRLLVGDLIALDRGEEALARLAPARERSPEAASLHDLHARILIALGRRDEGRQAFERALAADPGFAAAHTALARLALDEGRLEVAREQAEQAIALDPRSDDARYLLAESLFSQGAEEEGLARLREITEANPSHAAAANDLAWRLALRGEDLERALVLAKRAARLDGGPETLDTLGFVQLQSGNPAGAVESLGRSVVLRADPSVIYRLGLALDAVGRSDDALETFKKALDAGSFPEAEQARAQIARLEPQAQARP